MEKKFDQTAYKAAYNKANYSRIELKVPKDKKGEWEEKAKAEGLSLTAYIMRKVDGEMKEIYSSFGILEVGEQETGYKVFEQGDSYIVKLYALGESDQMFRINDPLDWTNAGAIYDAYRDVNHGVLDGAAHYKGRWYSTKTINQIQKDRQSYEWKPYV